MTKAKLNLGCGPDIRVDYENVDFKKLKGVDKVYDLNKFPWPYKDNTFTDVIAFNIIEHLNDAFLTFEELHRVCKNGAEIRIMTPHFTSGNCWADMQHKRGFSHKSFNHPNMLDKFDVTRCDINFPPLRFFMKPLVKKFPGFYEHNLAFILPSEDMYVVLKVKK